MKATKAMKAMTANKNYEQIKKDGIFPSMAEDKKHLREDCGLNEHIGLFQILVLYVKVRQSF